MTRPATPAEPLLRLGRHSSAGKALAAVWSVACTATAVLLHVGDGEDLVLAGGLVVGLRGFAAFPAVGEAAGAAVMTSVLETEEPVAAAAAGRAVAAQTFAAATQALPEVSARGRCFAVDWKPAAPGRPPASSYHV